MSGNSHRHGRRRNGGASPNGAFGVTRGGSAGNTIGGTVAGSRNLISGNSSGGININGTVATGNQILGNFINVSGTAAIANGSNGINISNGAANNTVGGSSAATRNVVSGNLGSGIRIQNAGTTGNVVRGNYVGTNAAGTAAVANGAYGVQFGLAASGNTVGGLQPAEGNIDSGNGLSGLGFLTPGASGNPAIFNLIGTDVTGTAPLGNVTNGVYIQTSNNSIGSVSTGIGNTIAFNGFVGVRVDSGTGNAIVNNSIRSNGSLGIDLAPHGVTPNDAGDADIGPNNLQNFPLLTSARTVGTDVRVQVSLTPPPSGPFLVHFYGSPTCDASGAGEGATPLGVASFGVSTDPTVTFEGVFPASLVPAGSYLTATATDSGTTPPSSRSASKSMRRRARRTSPSPCSTRPTR